MQGFPAYCGFEVKHVEYGIFESWLRIRSEHTQQDGFVHAGVIASMADHTGGHAAFTTVSAEFRILTIEFKIDEFVKNSPDGKEKLVSKAMVTMMAVPVSELT